MSNILEIRNLKVMFGKSIAIHDVSLKVPEGGYRHPDRFQRRR